MHIQLLMPRVCLVLSVWVPVYCLEAAMSNWNLSKEVQQAWSSIMKFLWNLSFTCLAVNDVTRPKQSSDALSPFVPQEFQASFLGKAQLCASQCPCHQLQPPMPVDQCSLVMHNAALAPCFATPARHQLPTHVSCMTEFRTETHLPLTASK